MSEHPDDTRLDAYVEDLLDAHERADVDAHLAGCARCRDEIAALRTLLERMRALPRSIDPGADLRPAIRAARDERRLADERRRWARSLRVPLAAAAVLLVALGAGVTALVLSDGDERFELTERGRRTVVLASFEARRADYVRSAAEQAALLERHRDELAPETVALVEQNLRTIERALAEAEAALRADPASPVVRELILATEEQKVDVLRWANALVEG
jgi:hypothetical protein